MTERTKPKYRRNLEKIKKPGNKSNKTGNGYKEKEEERDRTQGLVG